MPTIESRSLSWFLPRGHVHRSIYYILYPTDHRAEVTVAFFNFIRDSSKEEANKSLKPTMDDDKAITPESYDAAESWCNEIVSSKNNDILYNPALFRQALHQTSQDLHFPISVGFSL